MDTRRAILARLGEALDPESVDVVDESAAHRGHAGAAAGGGHFRLRVWAEAFRDKPLLERHRMVYQALEAEMRSGAIHALSMELHAPDEDD